MLYAQFRLALHKLYGISPVMLTKGFKNLINPRQQPKAPASSAAVTTSSSPSSPKQPSSKKARRTSTQTSTAATPLARPVTQLAPSAGGLTQPSETPLVGRTMPSSREIAGLGAFPPLLPASSSPPSALRRQGAAGAANRTPMQLPPALLLGPIPEAPAVPRHLPAMQPAVVFPSYFPATAVGAGPPRHMAVPLPERTVTGAWAGSQSSPRFGPVSSAAASADLDYTPCGTEASAEWARAIVSVCARQGSSAELLLAAAMSRTVTSGCGTLSAGSAIPVSAGAPRLVFTPVAPSFSAFLPPPPRPSFAAAAFLPLAHPVTDIGNAVAYAPFAPEDPLQPPLPSWRTSLSVRSAAPDLPVAMPPDTPLSSSAALPSLAVRPAAPHFLLSSSFFAAPPPLPSPGVSAMLASPPPPSPVTPDAAAAMPFACAVSVESPILAYRDPMEIHGGAPQFLNIDDDDGDGDEARAFRNPGLGSDGGHFPPAGACGGLSLFSDHEGDCRHFPPGACFSPLFSDEHSEWEVTETFGSPLWDAVPPLTTPASTLCGDGAAALTPPSAFSVLPTAARPAPSATPSSASLPRNPVSPSRQRRRTVSNRHASARAWRLTSPNRS